MNKMIVRLSQIDFKPKLNGGIQNVDKIMSGALDFRDQRDFGDWSGPVRSWCTRIFLVWSGPGPGPYRSLLVPPAGVNSLKKYQKRTKSTKKGPFGVVRRGPKKTVLKKQDRSWSGPQKDQGRTGPDRFFGLFSIRSQALKKSEFGVSPLNSFLSSSLRYQMPIRAFWCLEFGISASISHIK